MDPEEDARALTGDPSPFVGHGESPQRLKRSLRLISSAGSSGPIASCHPSKRWARSVTQTGSMSLAGSFVTRSGREALEIQRAALSPRSERLASTLVRLGWSLLGQGRAREAEPLLREALSIREETLVGGHWQIAEARSVLGGCLSMLGRHAEAEPLLRGAYRQLQAAYGDSHPRTRRALEELNRHRERSGREKRESAVAAVASAPPGRA